MTQTVRIATFNCENLFSRPKIFGLSSERSQELLRYVSELQKELSKPVFDQERIEELRNKLKGYATINNIRGDYKKATGAKDWLGVVELTRDKFNDTAVDNVARVIADTEADVTCLIEVESRPLLQKFHDDILLKKFLMPKGARSYEHILLIDGNDERGIDVAVMSHLPVSWIRSHVHEHIKYNEKMVPTFSRDCLEVQVEMPDKKPLYLMINHFKSMGSCPDNDKLCNRRREGQATRVAQLVDEHNLQQEYVAVTGDLNSDSTSKSLSPLLEKQGLYNVNLNLDPSQRGTYRTEKTQLDYIIVSDALKERLQGVRIERRGIYAKNHPHYDTVTSLRTEASDHAAVIAEFEF